VRVSYEQINYKISGAFHTFMAHQAATVADIFRRAQALKRERPQINYKDLRKAVADEFRAQPFPAMYNLTIPEQDNRAPEEDWSAGLSIVARGIQTESWDEVASGIILCLEQTEGYEHEHGNTGRATIGTTAQSAFATRSKKASTNGCRMN
jgi:hypothetical protein